MMFTDIFLQQHRQVFFLKKSKIDFPCASAIARIFLFCNSS